MRAHMVACKLTHIQPLIQAHMDLYRVQNEQITVKEATTEMLSLMMLEN